MNFETMTDKAVAKELGQRIEQLRLELNKTQQQVADAIGISRVSYGKLEAGEAKFVNMIAVMRVLGQIQQFDKLLPDSTFSPIELLKMKGKKRKRAGASKKPEVSEDNNGVDW